MNRRTLTLAAWLLALVLAGLLLAWGRSHLPEQFTLRSRAGSVLLIFAHPQHFRRPDTDQADIPTGDLLQADRRLVAVGSAPPSVDWRGAGFELFASDLEYGFVIAGVPYWAPAVLTAAALAWVLVVRRRHPAPGPGDCEKCGYSLTGNTSGTCPECGTPAGAAG